MDANPTAPAFTAAPAEHVMDDTDLVIAAVVVEELTECLLEAGLAGGCPDAEPESGRGEGGGGGGVEGFTGGGLRRPSRRADFEFEVVHAATREDATDCVFTEATAAPADDKELDDSEEVMTAESDLASVIVVEIEGGPEDSEALSACFCFNFALRADSLTSRSAANIPEALGRDPVDEAEDEPTTRALAIPLDFKTTGLARGMGVCRGGGTLGKSACFTKELSPLISIGLLEGK